ncbi:RNA polymerase, sigma-24 subunit, ECF subfamily [Hymenobacter roseosalivarius DSM 11622]|uniref:RNA polymerase sigma factor n=1 Tax=Hymenobacter roseosalivarius DSM 11622 TaxID=645990 RepID=A0A1W1V1M1_9BACT|nr:sigma-70 family RNA polymerase sigma factor [Hymenobacter roseosalivarius]SMB87190.1 RNA polymerase, sigma-24 subunit, ECF subfamily [Hymenobacter roseosalivarius DSM 11622]
MAITLTRPEPALWLERYGDELYRFALGRVADRACAEELVQETLLSALQALASFRGESSERTWLFLILRRKIIDHYRHQARHPEVSLSQITPDDSTEADFFDPQDGHWRQRQYPAGWQSADGALEQQELHQTLRGCQDKLPAQHAAVFVLRFVEELTAEEICKELRLTTSNYWVIIHRAKLQLRRCLENHGLGRVA